MPEAGDVLGRCTVLASGVHASLTEALCGSLRRAGATAAPGSADLDVDLRAVAACQPDICVLEEALAGRRLADAVSLLRRDAPRTRVVLLASGEQGGAQDAYAGGLVEGLVGRGAGLDALLDVVQCVLRGEQVDERVRSGGTAVDRRRSGESTELTEREREVLGCLARGDSNATIASQLGISVNTVRTHVQSLLRKLGIERRGQVATLNRPDVLVEGDLTRPRDGRRDGHLAPRPVVVALAASHRCLAEALADEIGERTAGPARCVESVADAGAGVAVLHSESDVLELLRATALSGAGALAFTPSTTHDDDLLAQGLEVGGQGWLAPEASVTDVVAALHTVAHGDIYLSPTVLTPVLRRLMRQSPERSDEPAFMDSLSPRELEIMRCLVAGMTKREIADRLFLSVHTVHSHVQRMMRRADRHTTVALVAVARRHGVTAAGPRAGGVARGGVGLPRQRPPGPAVRQARPGRR